jgi:hypothetical protein
MGRAATERRALSRFPARDSGYAPTRAPTRALPSGRFGRGGKSAAAAERVIRAGARLSPTLGLAGRQLAAGIGGQVPGSPDYCLCSAGNQILKPSGS